MSLLNFSATDTLRMVMNTPKGREKIFALFFVAKTAYESRVNFVHTTTVISTFVKER